MMILVVHLFGLKVEQELGIASIILQVNRQGDYGTKRMNRTLKPKNAMTGINTIRAAETSIQGSIAVLPPAMAEIPTDYCPLKTQ
jgi:hypothetical protein